MKKNLFSNKKKFQKIYVKIKIKKNNFEKISKKYAKEIEKIKISRKKQKKFNKSPPKKSFKKCFQKSLLTYLWQRQKPAWERDWNKFTYLLMATPKACLNK